MRKRFAMILAVAVFVGLNLPAATADMIWEPYDDFYTAHYRECVRVDGLFEAAADTHTYKKPDGSILEDIPAGKVLDISYIWNDRWGSVNWTNDWVDLHDFRRLMDSALFYAAHKNEMIDLAGSIDLVPDAPLIRWDEMTEEVRNQVGELPETGAYQIVLWKYPGSEAVEGLFNGSRGDDDYWGADSIRFFRAYQDDTGHLWLHVDTYYYGSVNGWIYLSDMSSREPPFVTSRYADEEGEGNYPGENPGDNREETTQGAGMTGGSGSNGTRPPTLPIVAVCLVTALTAILLVALKVKKPLKA